MSAGKFHIPKKATPYLFLIVWAIAGYFIFKINDPTPSPEQPWLRGASSQKDEIVLFFSRSRGPEMVTEGVIRQIPSELNSAPKTALLEYTISELLKGPSSQEGLKGFISEIPIGTKLLSVTQTDKSIRVNLSSGFTAGGGSNSMVQRIKELSQTILAQEKQTPVFIDVEGQELQALGGEGIEVAEPINKSLSGVQ